MKLRVGDWVNPLVCYVGQDGCSYIFENSPYRIERFNGSKIYLEGIDYPCFEESQLEKVENKLEVTTDYKDPKYCMVRDSEYESWEKEILINDNSNFNSEFSYGIVADDEKKRIFEIWKI